VDFLDLISFSLCPFPTLYTSVNVGSRTLRLQQWPGWKVGSGGFVWNGARRLITHFETYGDGCGASGLKGPTPVNAIAGRPWKNLTVLELGAGTGAAGLAAVSLGATVTLTDQASFFYPTNGTTGKGTELSSLQSLVDLLNINVENNGAIGGDVSNAPKVAELLWGDTSLISRLPFQKYDLICGSDILLFSSAHEDLIRTLRCLSHSDTVVLIEHTDRAGGESGGMHPEDMRQFISLLAKDGLWTTKVVKDHGRHITLRMVRRNNGDADDSMNLPAQVQNV